MSKGMTAFAPVYGSLLDEARSRTATEVADQVRALAAERCRIEAELAVMVREAERREVHRADGHLSVPGWLRATVSWSTAECLRVVRRGRLLERAPVVGDALLDGSCGVAQTDELARAAANPRVGHEIDPFLPVFLEHAPVLSFDEFKTVVRRWENLADADGAHRTREASIRRRRARLSIDDAVMWLSAEGATLEGVMMREILDAYLTAEVATDRATMAETGATQFPRTDAQRRFDALHAIFLAAASTPADAERPVFTANVVVDQVTFEAHLARLGFIPTPTDLPDLSLLQRRCESDRGDPLAPDDILAAAFHGHVRRVVFDSAGVVIDLGRRRRLFTGPAAEAVTLQRQHCDHRGCDIPSSRCESDHINEWDDGGPSNQHNGSPRCGVHNRLKSRRGFRTRRDPDGRWHTYRPDGTEITWSRRDMVTVGCTPWSIVGGCWTAT